MSQFETIARPYAKAAFEQAGTKNRNSWQAFLAAGAAMLADEDTAAHLKAPGFYDALTSWLDEYLQKKRGKGLYAEEKNFLHLLHDNHRLVVLPEIFEQYMHLVNLEGGVCQAVVYTAHALTDVQKKAIVKKLSEKTSRKVELDVREDSSLLAGVRIEYDGLVLDQSTKGRIAEFAQNLDDLRN